MGKQRGIENARKRMRTYSMYFCIYFTWLLFVSCVLGGILYSGWVLWGEYEDGKEAHTQSLLNNSRQLSRIEALERICKEQPKKKLNCDLSKFCDGTRPNCEIGYKIDKECFR